MAERRVHIRPGEVASSVIDGEGLIIDLSTGVYYSLPGSAGYVWALLERGLPTGVVAAAVANRYGIETSRALADVDRLVDQMIDESIVTSADAGPASDVSTEIDVGSPGLRPYEPPALVRYDDMEDLLALDPPMPGITDLPWQGADQSGSGA